MQTDVKPKRKSQKRAKTDLTYAYAALHPISSPKYADLQVLKQFVKPENRELYDSLPKISVNSDQDNDLF